MQSVLFTGALEPSQKNRGVYGVIKEWGRGGEHLTSRLRMFLPTKDETSGGDNGNGQS